MIGSDRNDAVAADAPNCRAETDKHVRVRRTDDGTSGIAADVTGPETGGGAYPGTRSAGLKRRSAIECGLTWIGTRIVRIETKTPDCIVVAGHWSRCSRNPVRQLRQSGFRDDDRASGTQILCESRFVWRRVACECECAAGRRKMRCVNVVLQRDRNPVKRTAHLSLSPLTIEFLGFLQRIGIDCDDRVQPILINRDPCEILNHQLA